MKVVISGSRSILDSGIVDMAVAESGFEVSEVISGGAKGVDSLGESWAEKNEIPVTVFAANWEILTHPDAIIRTNSWGQKYDSKAGLRRNELMAVYADALIAIWDGKSRGTKHMIKMARKRELPIYVYRTDIPRKSGHMEYETKRQFYQRVTKQANAI